MMLPSRGRLGRCGPQRGAGPSGDSPRRHGRVVSGRRARRPALARVAVEPAAARRRPARDSSPPRRPGAIAVIDNTFATPLASSARARRRPRPAFGDEVPRRALRPDAGSSGRSGRRARRPSGERRVLAGAIPRTETYLAVRAAQRFTCGRTGDCHRSRARRSSGTPSRGQHRRHQTGETRRRSARGETMS